MNNLAIIPARGGSKRIPKKNIIDFFGIPVLSYSIKAAIESNLFEDVIVSTDNEEIKEIAIQYGATVPFLRSKENSDDNSTTSSVIEEVILKLKNNKVYNNICCIYPCSPLIRSNTIIDSYDYLINNKVFTVFPVVKYSNPVQRALKIEKNKINFLFPENSLKRTQDFEDLFYDAGQFYWLKTQNFLEHKKLITNNSAVVILDELEAQDIDNLKDLKLAKIKFKLMNEGKI